MYFGSDRVSNYQLAKLFLKLQLIVLQRKSCLSIYSIASIKLSLVNGKEKTFQTQVWGFDPHQGNFGRGFFLIIFQSQSVCSQIQTALICKRYQSDMTVHLIMGSLMKAKKEYSSPNAFRVINQTKEYCSPLIKF